jgi:hypothetical protein
MTEYIGAMLGKLFRTGSLALLPSAGVSLHLGLTPQQALGLWLVCLWLHWLGMPLANKGGDHG